MGITEEFSRLLKIIEDLRGPQGCPWDREQTPKSIRSYCLEEAYEVVDAIEGGDAKSIQDELGDLLMQVVFQAQFGKEAGTFTMEDVLRSVNEKLIRRHPHVFRRRKEDQVRNADEVLERWSKIKRSEGRKRLLDGVPRSLPALLRADRMSEKAASVGFDWPDTKEVLKKVEEEMAEVRAVIGNREQVSEEIGDLLFVLANLARHENVDAELALLDATKKFEARIRWMEDRAQVEGRDLADYSLEELELLWTKAKEETRSHS